MMANIELRYIFSDFILFGQHFKLGTNLFSDMGMVTQRYKVDLSKVPDDERKIHFTGKEESMHTSCGIGLKVALNNNFVVSADWGKAIDKNDGSSGFYVMMNYLF